MGIVGGCSPAKGTYPPFPFSIGYKRKGIMKQNDYILIKRNLLNDAVWDMHNVPKGTPSVFLFIAMHLICKDRVPCIDLDKLATIRDRSMPVKEFRKAFNWLRINGYINAEQIGRTARFKVSLTDKSNSFFSI